MLDLSFRLFTCTQLHTFRCDPSLICTRISIVCVASRHTYSILRTSIAVWPVAAHADGTRIRITRREICHRRRISVWIIALILRHHAHKKRGSSKYPTSSGDIHDQNEREMSRGTLKYQSHAQICSTKMTKRGRKNTRHEG